MTEADKSYALTEPTVKRTAETVRRDHATLPERGRRLRRVMGGGSTLKRGILDGSLSATGTATVSVTEWDSEEEEWVDSDVNILPVRSGIPNIDTLDPGKVVWITQQGGAWFAIQAEC